MKQAIVLVGGKGTRIAALFPDRPKALVPVAGKPFIERHVEWLATHGFTDVHLAAGHMADAVARWAESATIPGITLTVSVEPSAMGTAGGLKYVEPFIKSDRFFALNGDSWLPRLDFQSLEKLHAASSNAWTTIAVVPIADAGRYGTVEFDEAGRVSAFREKAERSDGWINGGAYLMNREVLTLIPVGNISLETQIFPQLAAAGKLQACKSAPPLLDMGTPDGLKAMESFVKG